MRIFNTHVIRVLEQERREKSARWEEEKEKEEEGRIPPTGRKRGTKDKSSCCVYTERPTASACRTGCNLPPCYSRARAKLINGKVEALNAPRVSARALSPRFIRFVSRCCYESNGGKEYWYLYSRTAKCIIVTYMGKNIVLSSILYA